MKKMRYIFSFPSPIVHIKQHTHTYVYTYIYTPSPLIISISDNGEQQEFHFTLECIIYNLADILFITS